MSCWHSTLKTIEKMRPQTKRPTSEHSRARGSSLGIVMVYFKKNDYMEWLKRIIDISKRNLQFHFHFLDKRWKNSGNSEIIWLVSPPAGFSRSHAVSARVFLWSAVWLFSGIVKSMWTRLMFTATSAILTGICSLLSRRFDRFWWPSW